MTPRRPNTQGGKLPATTGLVHHTRGTEFAAFDSLPAEVKAAIREAAFDMTAVSARRLLDQGHPPAPVAKAVRQHSKRLWDDLMREGGFA